jgi:hypothetical protein
MSLRCAVLVSLASKGRKKEVTARDKVSPQAMTYLRTQLCSSLIHLGVCLPACLPIEGPVGGTDKSTPAKAA